MHFPRAFDGVTQSGWINAWPESTLNRIRTGFFGENREHECFGDDIITKLVKSDSKFSVKRVPQAVASESFATGNFE
jgi:hypothetical protein